MTALLILPIAVPLLTAVVCLLSWGRRGAQRVASVVGAVALCGSTAALLAHVWAHGILAVQVGNWPAPFGITLVADALAALLVAVTGIMGLAATVYSLGAMDPPREASGYYALLHALLAGVCGAFLTGDVFNLFVWYEVMLMASFVLMALGGERAQLEGSIKYVTLNLMASTLFLTAVGLLYALAGSLNMADLAMRFETQPTLVPATIRLALAVLFLVAFGIKAAVFPLFGWLPASYHTPPVAVTVILSALLTKVGVYSLLRLFTLLFAPEAAALRPVLLVIAATTMITGVLGAVAQYDMRRLLSFHIVSQIGYLIMGLALGTPLALAAAVFFLVHVIFAKSALFMVSGIAQRLLGGYDLRTAGGLYRRWPALAAAFLVPALALAGVPPLSGFFGKLGLVQAGLQTGQYGIVAVALGVSLLTMFSMMKIWTEAFWKPRPPVAGPAEADAMPGPVVGWHMFAPTVAVAALTVVLGLGTAPGFAFAQRAADQLVHPQAYVRAVLRGGDRPCSW